MDLNLSNQVKEKILYRVYIRKLNRVPSIRMSTLYKLIYVKHAVWHYLILESFIIFYVIYDYMTYN